MTGRTFQYRQVSKRLLLGNCGLERKGAAMALAERAFLDAVHIDKDYHFDNLEALIGTGFSSCKVFTRAKRSTTGWGSIINSTGRSMLDKARQRVKLMEFPKDLTDDPGLRTALGFWGGRAAMLFLSRRALWLVLTSIY